MKPVYGFIRRRAPRILLQLRLIYSLYSPTTLVSVEQREKKKREKSSSELLPRGMYTCLGGNLKQELKKA